MDETKALEILYLASRKYKGDGDEHDTIKEAINVISQALNRLKSLESEATSETSDPATSDPANEPDESSEDTMKDPNQ